MITDHGHVTTAKALRADFNRIRRHPTSKTTVGEILYRPLSVYGELFELDAAPRGQGLSGQFILHGWGHERVLGLGRRGRLGGDGRDGQGLIHAHGVSRGLDQVGMME